MKNRKQPVNRQKQQVHSFTKQDSDYDWKKNCQHLDFHSIDACKKFYRNSKTPPTCQSCAGKYQKPQKQAQRGGKKQQQVVNSKTPPESLCVCLMCGEVFCYGTTQNHASDHKGKRHSLISQLRKWNCRCLFCDVEIPLNVPQTAEIKQCVEALQGREPPKVVVETSETSEKSQKKNTVNQKDEDEDRWRGKKYNKNEVVNVTGVKGLNNLGNTCFFNSIVQCLTQTEPLIEQFVPRLMKPDEPAKVVALGPMARSLKTVLEDLWSIGAANKGRVCSPKPLFNEICQRAKQFQGHRQQDAQEVLRYMLDGLITEEKKVRIKAKEFRDNLLKSTNSDNEEKRQEMLAACELAANVSESTKTTVESIFQGQLVSIITCHHCGEAKAREEDFLDLSLSIPVQFLATARERALFSNQRGNNNRGRKMGPQAKQGLSKKQMKRMRKQERERDMAKKMNQKNKENETENENESEKENENGKENETENKPEKGNENDNETENTETEKRIQKENDPEVEKVNENKEIKDDNVKEEERKEENDTKQDADKLGSEDSNEKTNGSVAEVDTPHPSELRISTDTSENNFMPHHPSELRIPNSEPHTEVGSESQTEKSEVESRSQTEKSEITEIESRSHTGKPEVESGSHTEKPEVESGSQAEKSEITEIESRSHTGKPEVESGSQTEKSEKPEVEAESKTEEDSNTLVLEPEYKEADAEDEDEEDEEEDEDDEDEEENDDELTDEEKAIKEFRAQILKKLQQTDEEMSKEDRKFAQKVDARSFTEVPTGCSILSCLHLYTESEILDEDNRVECYSCTRRAFKRASLPLSILTNLYPNEEKSYLQQHPDEEEQSDVNEIPSLSGRQTRWKIPLLKRTSTKQFLIKKPPPILTIHLKRFFHVGNGQGVKVGTFVQFPSELELSPYILPSYELARISKSLQQHSNTQTTEETQIDANSSAITGADQNTFSYKTSDDSVKYRLYGVCNHSGGMNSGHYTAFIRVKLKEGRGDWYYISDQNFHLASQSDVFSSQAYVLFYERI